MRAIIYFALIFLSFCANAQRQEDARIFRVKRIYDSAYLELKAMLEKRNPMSFKRAVFITENAYRENLDYKAFNDVIAYFARRCKALSDQWQFLYNDRDKEVVKKNAAIFKFMTDTIKYYIDST